MGILGWHSGSVFFVAGYIYKKNLDLSSWLDF